METIEAPLHEHPLILFTRFDFTWCQGCCSSEKDSTYIYGGYRCNEPGCDAVFHKECAKPLPEVNHSYHPDHSLRLILYLKASECSFCNESFKLGYCCSICNFKLDLKCVRRRVPLVLPEMTYGHEHPLELELPRKPLREEPEGPGVLKGSKFCKACHTTIFSWKEYYRCHQCEFVIHLECVDVAPEANHTFHEQHLLKPLSEVPAYADNKCLHYEETSDQYHHPLHHCDVCNFTVCRGCIGNPPPDRIVSPRTHQHELQLFPRRLDFTCNACGTRVHRSPYFCLQCNFMIHRECIDLPRVININRHDHRISYTPRLGHGEWKCGVCRKEVKSYYGAYTCSKCLNYVVHSTCATRKDVWDLVEREGTSEEEEIPPFEKIDDKTIKHFSHGHNLQLNMDGMVLPESTRCVACVSQICSEPFYNCKQCNFILHEKCANLPRKRRHVCHNQRLTLSTDSHQTSACCNLCEQDFTGFRYIYDRGNSNIVLDLRCGTITEPVEHKSHADPLYYSTNHSLGCSECGKIGSFCCDECTFSLDYKCAILPQKVRMFRYDDHLLFFSCGESNVNGEIWCEACETKVKPKNWFYRCNECAVTLHVSCVLGDLTYMMPGSCRFFGAEIVSNTSSCRPLCSGCNSRCKLPSVLKTSKAGGKDLHFCSSKCFHKPQKLGGLLLSDVQKGITLRSKERIEVEKEGKKLA